MKIMIFSGTYEGRRLSECLSREGIGHFVCVATDYGRDIMPQDPGVKVNSGRMDSRMMEEYMAENDFGRGDVVVDATHPYAARVSLNVREAAQNAGCKLIRIARPSSTGGRRFQSIGEFAAFIDGSQGNILLTTGTNMLEEYCRSVSAATLDRTFVRIIPSAESLDICQRAGIGPSHIIAAQGPFSYDMNSAMLRQYKIRHMLTKDGGEAGGFYEKCTAAYDAGVSVNVIARPMDTEGVSFREAFEMLSGRKYTGRLKITLAGYGPGGKSCATFGVAEAIAGADAVFSSKRLVDAIEAPRKYEMYAAKDIIGVLEENEDIENAVVLFSGDSGFYSGAKDAYKSFKDWREDADITILPGIASVSYMAAKAGVSWADAALASIHGRNSERDIDILLDSIKHNSMTFALVSSDHDVRRVAKGLSGNDDITIWAGCNLSYEDEEITSMTPETAAGYSRDGIITLLFINTLPQKRLLSACIEDSEFIREDVPMTKEVIRHESIRRLMLRKGDVVYDIGGGTGSVAVEMASADPELKVTTIEKNPGAVRLINKNISKFGLHNITVIKGDAAEEIKSLPRPDCVFIGGSGGKLSEILEALHQKGGGVRIVVNAVSLETMEDIKKLTGKYNAVNVKMTMIAVSDYRTMGDRHILQAQNPVTIISFEL